METKYTKGNKEDISNYYYMFDFEKNFDFDLMKNWFLTNWLRVGVIFITLYLITIFTIQKEMKNRKRFELRTPLIIWNTSLAIFSIFGFIRTFPQLWHLLSKFGFYHSICAYYDSRDDIVACFWACLFGLSKIPELGDTLFIVLRKQKLIFLHWYHHVTVLYFAMFTGGARTNGGSDRYFMVINFFCHSLMYTYYAFKAAKFSPPKFIAMFITSVQIIQMVIGVFVTLSTIYYGDACFVTEGYAKLSLFVYVTYFFLFGKFFYDAYLGPKSHYLRIKPKDKSL